MAERQSSPRPLELHFFNAVASMQRNPADDSEWAGESFYQAAIRALKRARVPLLIGGAYALEVHAGVVRRTKDLDVFVRAEHVEPALNVLSEVGYRTELTFPHWLGKAFCAEHFIDLIFNSGNGICPVEAAGIKVLDGESIEIDGVGFAGAKGFGGGFGPRLLEPWGERAMKAFVQEALDETLKLESALAKLKQPQRFVLLHYAPIAETVEGEPREIYPFLGSSRLEDPIDRHGCAAVFHGHAHHGAAAGKTRTGIPVFNVSLNLLRAGSPPASGYRLFDGGGRTGTAPGGKQDGG